MVIVLPLPAAHHFHILCFDGLDATQNLNKMALGLGILLSGLSVLATEQRRTKQGDQHLNRHNSQGNSCEQPAVKRHHHDVNHGERCIEDRCEGLARQEITDFLQFGNTGAQLTNRPLVEIAEG